MSTPQLGLNVKQLATSLLTYVIDFWQNAVDAEPLPDVQIITGGEVRLIAWDCDQLTVALTGIDIDVPAVEGGPMAAQRLSNNTLRHVEFTVQLVRCAANMDNDGHADPAEIHTKGLIMMRDAGLLSQALLQWCGEITTAPHQGALHLGGGLLARGGLVVPVGPSGGKMAVEGSVLVSAALLV